MQILQIPEGLDAPVPVLNGRSLEPGKEYITTNAFTGQMLLSRCPVQIDGKTWALRMLLKSYSIEFDEFDPSEDWNNKDVWLMRGGGFGDLLMLTPLIRELKKRWPEIWIHVSCGEQYDDVFDGLGVIVEKMPIPYDKQTRIDSLIAFEDTVEGDPRARELSMPQLFAHRAGITLTDLKPDYRVTPEEKEWAWDTYPLTDLPRVGIQFLASGLYRSYPKTDAVMLALAKKAQVFLIGQPGQIELTQEVPNLINLMGHKLSFRQSAALVSTCDVCVSPDSALVHLCSALNVPCIGLYGPFPSRLRLTTSLAYAFDGVAACAPCFFHADHPNHFPAGMPCAKALKCVALDSIPVDDIVNRVMSFLIFIALFVFQL